MDTKKWYAKKSEWAAAQAADLRATAERMRYESSKGSSLKAARKFSAIANLRTEAIEWDARAAHYRKLEARGVFPPPKLLGKNSCAESASLLDSTNSPE